MERNSNTAGGDNNDFEYIMRESGASDELTPPYRWTYRGTVAIVQSLRIK